MENNWDMETAQVNGAKKARRKAPLIVASLLVGSVAFALAIPFSVLGIRSSVIDNDYSYLFEQGKIQERKLEVPLVKQEISCGYAIIEMLSDFYGNRTAEAELYARNGNSVSTSSTGGFVAEINKTIDPMHFISKEYMKNDELLIEVNKSLLNGNPVAVEWAAKLGEEWTLHWSIVTGMSLEKVFINNSYGYTEELSYSEFIARTTFKAFENMHIGYQFGFAFGLFSKNTIIAAE